MPAAIAGVLEHIGEMTAFLNPTEESFRRFGSWKAPRYVSWSAENRSQLIRVPAAEGEYRRAELRSPDSTANPYLAFAALIYAGLHGIEWELPLPEPADVNLQTASHEVLEQYQKLPTTLASAQCMMAYSQFVQEHFPKELISAYCSQV